MTNLRLIARLDVKGAHLIKGVHLEGVRKLGDPQTFAQAYYRDGIDEIIYIDAVASLYGRNNLTDIVCHTAEEVFIPITVGGGVRSIDDASLLLRSGADKIAVNTAATQSPHLISELAEKFGSQCVVLSIQAKRRSGGGWEAYADLGREHTGLDVVEWAQKGQELGAGEILITSVDQEGTREGFDIELVKNISAAVSIPVIASGGMGTMAHLIDVSTNAGADAVAMAHVLHYQELTVPKVRRRALDAGLNVRRI
jgi:cyclase